MTMTAEHEPGLRERKKLQTLRRLRAVALRLATERGVEHVTVEDIAAEAEVSTRTFFNYFASKEDALIGADPTSAADLARALADRPADEAPLESLRQLMLIRAATMAEHVDDVRARMALVIHCPALQPSYLATASAYDRILKKWRGGVVVAEAVAGRCSACQILLRPQYFQDLKKGSELMFCESCGRILYYNPPVSFEDVATAK